MPSSLISRSVAEIWDIATGHLPITFGAIYFVVGHMELRIKKLVDAKQLSIAEEFIFLAERKGHPPATGGDLQRRGYGLK